MKQTIFKHISLLFLISLISFPGFSKVESFFTPHQGKEGFGQIYQEIENAKKSVEVTIYSWSAVGLEKAIEKGIQNNNISVRIVLHPKLIKKQSIKDKVEHLERLGAQVKISTKDMHEKFVLVDDTLAINTSGNFSNGAQNKYSENIVFHYDDGEEHIKQLIQSFNTEFNILWNYSRPYDKSKEYTSTLSELHFEGKDLFNVPMNNEKNIFLSSSMNFNGKKVNSSNQQPLSLRIASDKPWTIKDAIIAELDKAKHTVHLCLNHFFIKEIADKLIQIHRDRGVIVKFAVDNQEYKTSKNTLEMTPYFVKEWLKLHPGMEEEIPVRVKFYSHRPSFRYWSLNHHKFLIIDQGTADQTLINGSYNLSKKAEQGQFDNMVIYKGQEYSKLIDSFFNEFENMWFYNRNQDDSVNQDFIQYFFTIKNGYYPLHHYSSQSLTWNEVSEFQKAYNQKLNIRYLKISGNERHCTGFNPVRESFNGCP